MEADICGIIKVKISMDSLAASIGDLISSLNENQKCLDNSCDISCKTYAALAWKEGDLE